MKRFDDMLRQWARGSWLSVATGLVVVCLVLFLPGLTSLPPVDRDEASFAQSSRQMYASGDLIDIRLHDQTRYKKPVGIYWLQTAAVALTGGQGEGNIVTYRAVSLVAAIASVLLTWRMGVVLAGAEVGVIAAVLLAATFVLGAEARLAKTDATLLATVLAAEYVLARLWMGGDALLSRPVVLTFWAALGVSVLIKGPIGPMVIGLTLLTLMMLRRGWRWARPLASLTGLGLFAVIVSPWYLAITLRTGGDFWAAALGRDLIGKMGQAQESHGAPPGSYLAAMWLTFWPAALPLALGLPALWRGRGLRGQGSVAFLLCWLVPTWVVFELVATKLVHYVLPVYPALAILTAIGLVQTSAPLAGLWRKLAAGLLLALPVVLLAVLSVAAMRYGARLPMPALFGILGVSLVGPPVWRALRDGYTFAAVAGLAALGLSLSAGFYPTSAGVTSIWPSAAVARARAAFTACADPVEIVAGYREPSVIFALGSDVLLTSGAEAAARFADAPCALAFVSDAERPAFDAALSRKGITAQVIGRIDGTNIGSGAQVRLAVLARKAE